MITPVFIETERLYLNPLHRDIVDRTLKEGAFTESMTIHGETMDIEYPEGWTGQMYTNFPELAATFDDDIIGTMTIISKEDRKAIGLIGVKYEAPDVSDLKMVEFGYGIMDEYQGKGIGTEALKGFMEFMKYHSEFDRAVAKVSRDNPASERILRKNGFDTLRTGKDRKGNEYNVYLKSIEKNS